MTVITEKPSFGSCIAEINAKFLRNVSEEKTEKVAEIIKKKPRYFNIKFERTSSKWDLIKRTNEISKLRKINSNENLQKNPLLIQDEENKEKILLPSDSKKNEDEIIVLLKDENKEEISLLSQDNEQKKEEVASICRLL